jgi:hypothetical protein
MHTRFAKIFGFILLGAGILGFFNNPIIGSTGFFVTGILDNITHGILAGILLVSTSRVVITLRVIGIFFLVFAIIGFSSPGEFSALGGLTRMNMALDVAGLVFGLLFVGVSYLDVNK